MSTITLYSCNKEENETNSTSEPSSVYILSATASPTASESVTIKNNSGTTQDLSGWTIGDENNPRTEVLHS